MIKRASVVLLSIIMCLGLVACGSGVKTPQPCVDGVYRLKKTEFPCILVSDSKITLVKDASTDWDIKNTQQDDGTYAKNMDDYWKVTLAFDGKDKVEVKLLARDNSLAGKITKGLFTSLPGVYKLEK